MKTLAFFALVVAVSGNGSLLFKDGSSTCGMVYNGASNAISLTNGCTIDGVDNQDLEDRVSRLESYVLPCIDFTNEVHCSGAGQTRNDRDTQSCVCDCNAGWTGANCEHDPCVSKTAANHCNAGGQPIVQGSTCGCGCNAGYSGASCQFTPCTSKTRVNHCNGNGSPAISGSTCSCTCDAGFSGNQCENGPCHGETSTSMCSGRGSPAEDGATCICECNVQSNLAHLGSTFRYTGFDCSQPPNVQGTGNSASCAEAVTTADMWGRGAKGIDFAQYSNRGLKWVGCCGDGCGPSDFICEDQADGLTFRSTGGVMRASHKALSNTQVWSNLLHNTYSGCCSNDGGLCNSPNTGASATQMCKALGYQSGTVQHVNTNTCPETTYDGSTWASDFVNSNGYGNNYQCVGKAAGDVAVTCDATFHCNSKGTISIGDAATCQCDCTGAYTGSNCERGPCYDKNAANHCNGNGNPFQVDDNTCGCDCETGYSGSQCEVTPCSSHSRSSLCSGNGSPVISGSTCQCSCDSGFSGSSCETGPCNGQTSANMCSSRGSPTEDGATCMCACNNGPNGNAYTGSDCSGEPPANSALCADVVTDASMWGRSSSSRGIDFRGWSNRGLKWIGCNGDGCGRNDFHCQDESYGMQFWSTGGVMRSSHKAMSNTAAWSNTLHTPFTGCCSRDGGLCNSPDTGASANQMCIALGFARGTVEKTNSNFCPETHYNGNTWMSDFSYSNGYGNYYKCYKAGY